MNRRPSTFRRPSRRALLIALVVAVALAVAIPVAAGAGDPLTESPSVQPWIGAIEYSSTMIDASPLEAPGETWAIGGKGQIYRYTDTGGWSEMPPPLDAEGASVTNLTPALGQLKARATPDGAVALLANQKLFLRDPGGLFHLAGAPTAALANAVAVSRADRATNAPAEAVSPTEEQAAPAIEPTATEPTGSEPPAPEQAAPATAATAPAAEAEPAVAAAEPAAEEPRANPEPFAAAAEPAPATEEPVATAEEPGEAPAEPLASAEEPAATVEEPSSTAEPSATTEEPAPATEEPTEPSAAEPSSVGPSAAATAAPAAAGPTTSSIPAQPAAAEPSAIEPPLEPGEQLYDTPLVAALSEGGKAGAFVVPTAGTDGVRDAVLHFSAADGWTREPICLGAGPACATPPTTFAVVAIDATSPQNAWLLASGTTAEAGLVLIHRVEEAGGAVWRPVSLAGSPYGQRTVNVAGTTVRPTPRSGGQPLVVTSEGVWANAKVTVGSSPAVDATIYYDLGTETVSGTWCDLSGAVGATFCGHPIGSAIGAGRTFAWADGTPYGQRIILGESQGALLRLSGTTFERIPGGGRGSGGEWGAAFSSPEEGWLGGGPVRYGGQPAPDRLRPWPVPFRHPLIALAAEPGKPVGAIGSEALAVGEEGEVARYLPGIGWSPETLLGPTGKTATPRLRAVAWPTEEEAFAVGDGGEMWRWRKATGLWESDPGKPATADVAVANFTGLAFDPGNPSRGYAVGKQGVLLGYGKQWTQESLPAGLAEANFTSIAFAGSEAITTYKIPFSNAEGMGYTGGILVEDGSGWRKDESFAAQLPPGKSESGLIGLASTPELVAGLPDGSAIVATANALIEREGATGAWHQAGALPGFPVALAAFREGGALRATVSVENEVFSLRQNQMLRIDLEAVLTTPPPGQAPVLLDPYPLATTGLVLRQTANGWEDEQHAAWPEASESGTSTFDRAEQPDAVLALLTDGEGSFGWAVGGDSVLQTAVVDRYPDDGQAAPGAAGAPLHTRSGWAALAIGGGAECLGPCADLATTGAGPWRWLPAAVQRADETEGVDAFINTGGGTAGPLQTDNFPHEEVGAAARLTLGAGSLPVYQAAASTDRDGAHSLESFLAAFQTASVPLGSRPVGPGIGAVSSAGAGHGYYSFDTTAGRGQVRVVVLDTSAGSLGEEQRCWLAGELDEAAAAGMPAIAVGNSAINKLTDAALDTTVLVTGGSSACGVEGAGASAYFFDEPGQNTESTLRSGLESMPTYGTGSLGYNTSKTPNLSIKPNSGFLIVEIDPAHASRLAGNRAPVVVRLIPNISELALDADDGTLLRRSQVALFEGLARRPQSGLGCRNYPSCETLPVDPYTPIPGRCVGASCIGRLEPEYHFTSSRPDIADFVAHQPTATDQRRLELDASGDPIPDSSSGILCAYNAGTTTVTVETGGLSYSMLVTVQPGRVRRPCGTVPLKNPPQPARAVPLAPLEFPEGEPTPRQPTPSLTIPPQPGPVPAPLPAPVPTVTPKVPPHVKAPPQPQPGVPFVAPPTAIAPLAVIVPPPPPPAAQTTPPSGTSPVTQPVTSPNPEDEEEAATEMVHHAVAHRDLVGRRAAAPALARRPLPLLAPATTPGPGIGLGPPLVAALMLVLTSLSGAALIARRRQPPLAIESSRRYQ